MSLENFSLFLACVFAEIFGKSLRLRAVFFNCVVKPFLFILGVGIFNGAVIETFVFYYNGFSDSVALRGTDTF